jgi:hypothetical protein
MGQKEETLTNTTFFSEWHIFNLKNNNNQLKIVHPQAFML